MEQVVGASAVCKMLEKHLHAFAEVYEFRLKFQWPDNNQIIMRIEHRGGGSVDGSVPVWWRWGLVVLVFVVVVVVMVEHV